MGHSIQNIHHLFSDVRYRAKTSAELREAMQRKRTELQERVAARRTRIQAMRDEYAIDAERLALLVMRYREKSGSISYEPAQGQHVVPAGVVANLVKEQQMIDSELSQMGKLDLVLRNLRDEEWYTHPRTGEVLQRQAIHELDDFELEYLGF